MLKLLFIQRFNQFFLHVYFNQLLAKVYLGPNVSSFAHDCGCVVNGCGAMAAIYEYSYYYYLMKGWDNNKILWYKRYIFQNDIFFQLYS